MGYTAYSQFFVGTNLFNIVQELSKSNTVEVKDNITNRVIGTKSTIYKYYLFNDIEFTDLFDIELELKKLGLEMFYTSTESNELFVGYGKKTTFKNKVLLTYIDSLKEDIEKVKVILEPLGYIGEIGIYSILYESY